MKKATRKKLIEWTITVILLILVGVVAWYRFFGPGSQPRRAPGGGPPEWNELSAVATVEVAEKPEEIRRGLMGRDSLAPDSGMYFLYTQTHRHGFYMKNTRIPLSIAFIRDDGVIVAIKDMQPFDETLVQPDADYKDALEMNQGWFAEKGIDVGDMATLRDGTVRFSRSR